MTAPARPDWHTHTPAEVLDGNIALTLQQVAYVLGLDSSGPTLTLVHGAAS